MSTEHECTQIGAQTSGETRLHIVDFGDSTNGTVGKLSIGELLTGTPTVVQHAVSPSTATAATIASVALNTASKVVNGRTCLASECVQFKASALTNGALYTFKVTATSDSNPAETLVAFVKVKVQDAPT